MLLLQVNLPRQVKYIESELALIKSWDLYTLYVQVKPQYKLLMVRYKYFVTKQNIISVSMIHFYQRIQYTYVIIIIINWSLLYQRFIDKCLSLILNIFLHYRKKELINGPHSI